MRDAQTPVGKTIAGCFSRMLLLLWLAGLLVGQSANRLQFEVASVKPSPPDRGGSSDSRTDPGNGVRITNAPLSAIIVEAYGIQDYQLSGAPGWIETQRYDIVGKPARASGGDPADLNSLSRAEENTREEQRNEMMRSLLADRFGLVVHKEQKEHTVYSLEVAKGGEKIKPLMPPWKLRGCNVNPGSIECFAGEIGSLAEYLSGMLHAPV